MRAACAIEHVLLGLSAGIVLTATELRAQTQPPGYDDARNAFSRLTLDQRVRLQVLLTAAGYWPAVPDEEFNTRIYNAIGRFQAENGIPPVGYLGPGEMDKLLSVGGSWLNQWDFQTIRHPITGTAIWVPLGLHLVQEPIQTGLKFTNQAYGLILTYDYFPQFLLRRSFDTLLSGLVSKGFKIEYSKLYRDQFFAVSFSDGNRDGYVRYHQLGAGGVGFTLYWNHNASDVHIERVATLISGSLWSAMSGSPFTSPFTVNVHGAAGTVSQTPSPNPTSVPGPEEKQQDAHQSTQGTGFFVTHDGLILTNAHVVSNCTEIRVAVGQSTFLPASLVARDIANDLALLKTSSTPARVAALRANVRLGESVEAFGYPRSNLLATSGTFTLGNVTALAGLGDDSRYLQVSAPVQPGNSGGPLLDQSGNLVGIVSAKLNALNVMMATKGDIPQNVNFAIKSSVAANFLQNNNVKYEAGEATQTTSPADLADQAKAMSVYVECR